LEIGRIFSLKNTHYLRRKEEMVKKLRRLNGWQSYLLFEMKILMFIPVSKRKIINLLKKYIIGWLKAEMN